MLTFSGRRASQHPVELAAFIRLLQAEGVTSYLEIGARHGDTFHAVMSALPVGSVGVAVDLPGGAWGVSSSAMALQCAADDLLQRGYDIEVLLGNSTGPGVLKSLGDRAFDAALIDGDHRYEGVLADWLTYRDRATLVAFHDIAGVGEIQRSSRLPVEVPRLWQEVKGSARRSIEFVAEGSRMGIGVLWP